MKHVVVTGSSGFLGSNLVRHLVEKGHRVSGIDNRLVNKAGSLDDKNAARFYDCDIVRVPQLDQSFEVARKDCGVDIHTVVHLAAKWSYDRNKCAEFDAGNAAMTANLISACKKFDVKQLIFASSVSALDQKECVISEKTSLISDCDISVHPYGKNKAFCERLVLDAARQSYVSAAVVRLTGVYNDQCNLPPLAWLMRRWSRAGLMSRLVPGFADTGLNLLHVEDFVTLIAEIIARDEKHVQQVVFMGAQHAPTTCSPNYVSQLDFYRKFRNAIHRDDRYILCPKSFLRSGLQLERIGSRFNVCEMPREPDWLIDFVDNPFCFDTRMTNEALDWTPTRHIMRDVDPLATYFVKSRYSWDLCQNRREHGNYDPRQW